jgi:hypothetical protein
MICQTKSYKSFIILPDDWSGVLRRIGSSMIDIGSAFAKAQDRLSFTKSILGPDRMFMNIVVTPLGRQEEVPSIEETRAYFEGFSERQGLFEASTGKIEVLSDDHFTAKYYRIGSMGAVLTKKYCLYVERMEYLITARLASASTGEGRPNEARVREKEEIYDRIVQSLFLAAK